jgi:uroporphyrinogen decarboxylase
MSIQKIKLLHPLLRCSIIYATQSLKEFLLMKTFIPDYTNIVKAAKNITPDRMPLYEHAISGTIMEKILNKKFNELSLGNLTERKEYFRNYTAFFEAMGYDTVSFECGIAPILPGGGALTSHEPGSIKNREDFNKYSWDSVKNIFFDKYSKDFELLGEVMPDGMKAIGGPGYGIFECVQEIVSYTELCYISADDPELYGDLFKKMGDLFFSIWQEFLKKYGHIFCVCRFGDDLGFKSSTLIPAQDIKDHVIPQYKRIIALVHSYNKPFLLHSCGKIFDVMDDLISIAKIDAKHSNEDQIALFSEWVNRYGDRIGNFGGIDTDHLCRKSEQEIKAIVKEVVGYSIGHGGFALGSGNSIPDYVPTQGYMAMIEAAREIRGE